MTDSDIIKALECCANFAQCTGCGYYKERDRCCVDAVMEDAVAMLKRQQAEIKRLKTEKDNLIRNYKECAMEAVRDFAGRLKERQIQPEYPWGDLFVTASMIDETVAEMEGKA